MDLPSPKTIKELFSQYESKPSKGLGQNFLIDKNTLNKIIAAADLKKSDTVLEIGPGIGTLTQELAQKAKKVIAIEKDPVMVNILEKTLENYKNIEIIHADALSFKLQDSSYKIVANIPYYITSPLIRKFLESANRPSEIILMVQKEVAKRICAKVPDMNLLAVSVQFYAKPEIISYVSKGCFWPSPKIDSAIIKIVPRDSALISADFRDRFFRIVKAGFSQPRKQLGNNFSQKLKKNKEEIEVWLKKNGIDPKQRAETLNVSDWQKLTDSFMSR